MNGNVTRRKYVHPVRFSAHKAHKLAMIYRSGIHSAFEDGARETEKEKGIYIASERYARYAKAKFRLRTCGCTTSV